MSDTAERPTTADTSGSTAADDAGSPGPDDTGVAPSSGERRPLVDRWAWKAACVAVPVVVGVVFAHQRRWVTEDAYINIRYVEQILVGNGPVFDSGVRVEGYTSPGWLFVLTVGVGLLGRFVEPGIVAVVLGLLLGGAALAFGTLASYRLWRRSVPPTSLWLIAPLGALVVALTRPYADWTTGGLENSLVHFWLALSFWLLVRIGIRHDEGDPPVGRPALIGSALWIGLGGLVRPEMAIGTVVFGTALLVVAWPGRKRALGVAAALVAPLIAYQVFRMGYYSSTLPNTAIAKVAGGAWWEQGRLYLLDFLDGLRPAIILPVLAAALGASLVLARGRRRVIALVAAPVVTGVLYTVYVVRVGGDYMGDRMLVAPWMALALPVFCVPLPKVRRAPLAAAAGAVLVLSLVAGIGWAARNPLDDPSGSIQSPYSWAVGDVRATMVQMTGRQHPVTLRDMAMWANLAGAYLQPPQKDDVFHVTGWGYTEELPLQRARGRWVGHAFMGILPAAAGPEVSFADYLGLVDPVASRLKVAGDRTRAKPGHEKQASPALLYAWVDRDPRYPAITQCGPMPRYLDGITAPLTPSLFLQNLVHAPGDTRIEIDPDPAVATKELCGP